MTGAAYKLPNFTCSSTVMGWNMCCEMHWNPACPSPLWWKAYGLTRSAQGVLQLMDVPENNSANIHVHYHLKDDELLHGDADTPNEMVHEVCFPPHA
jgi:hypothetical protein